MPELAKGNHGWRLISRQGSSILMVMVLIGDLVVVFGVPLSSLVAGSHGLSPPYPCQNRFCGCALAEAKDREIDPSQTALDKVALVKEKTPSRVEECSFCCSASKKESPSDPCDQTNIKSSGSVGEEGSLSGCSSSSRNPLVSHECCQYENGQRQKESVRWVVGIFACKCGGKRSVDWPQHEPGLGDLPFSVWCPDRISISIIPDYQSFCQNSFHTPPVPPP